MNEIGNPGFDDKDNRERLLIGFNFSRNLTAIAASPAPVVTVVRSEGTADATPSAMIDGASYIVTGGKVRQWVIGGVAGCRYIWTCVAYGTDGQRLVLEGTMLVR